MTESYAFIDELLLSTGKQERISQAVSIFVTCSCEALTVNG